VRWLARVSSFKLAEVWARCQSSAVPTDSVRVFAAAEVGVFFLLAGLHGHLGGEEGGDVVLARGGGGDVVAAAVGELHAEGLRAAGEDGGLVGGDDVGRGGMGEVGDEDVTARWRCRWSRGGRPGRRGRSS
jgi:hypothetical protein